MSKLIRIPGRKKEIGAALIVALQMITLTLIGLMAPLVSGPHQSAKAPAGSQVSAAQTQTGQAPTATVTREALRASAVFAKKLYAPQGTQVFNLAVTRAASAHQSAQQGAQQSAQEGAQQSEAPNEGPTLTTDQEDYQPYTYVYFTGTGFQPGETVNMIVVELDPTQGSFQPWDVVADENGNFQTSWYVFSEEFRGATLQATATGDTSGLTASARFTDAAFNYSPPTQSLTASAGGPAVSFTQDVTTSGSNHGQAFGATLQLSGSTLPALVTVSTSPTTLSFSGPVTETKSWSVVFTVPAGTPAGTYTVAIQANPDSGTGVGPGMGTAVTLTVTANQPPIALCHNVTVSAGANCTSDASIDNGSHDPDSGDTFTLSQSPPGPYHLGDNSVTLTVTDNHGASSTCTATVTVHDTTPPLTPVLADVTGQCSATIGAAPTTTDNCAGTVTGTTSDSLTRNTQGTSMVHWTFNDGNGNTTMATQNIVVDDTTPPATPVLPDVTGECSATISAAPTTTDNCVGTVTGTTSDSLTRNTQGTSMVHWTFDDGNGNTTMATQNIVVDDTTPPATPVLPDVTGECSATISAAPTTTDNCVGTVTGTTSDSLTRNTQGTSMVHWTFDDGNGNTTMATQNIVVDDTTPPATPVLPDVTGECSATISAAPTTTDNCVGTVTGTTSDSLTRNTQGTSMVHWTFDDGNGNTTMATQNIVVDDTTAPVPDVANLSDATGQCSATISGPPTATDNCSGPITGTTTDSLTRSTQGTSVVTWHFDDGNGNVSTQTQSIVVHDTTAPVPNAGSLPDATGQCSATISGAPMATDNCSGAITGTTTDPLTHSTQGTFVVTWHFDDGNGNVSTQTQSIVVHDTIAPATPVLPDVTGQCSATISAAPTTTDNCAGTVTGTTSDSLTRNTQGTSVVHWTFNDGNGNTTMATQNIVVDDTIAPATPVLPDVTGQCSATISAAPTTPDNCVGTVTGTTSDPLTRTTEGTSVVHWTFDDGNGNTTMATQNIVVHDTTPPVITHCPPDRPITATCPTTVPNLTGEVTATDNCGGAVTVTQTPAAGTQISVGTTTVTLHVKDALNNEATCTAMLTVSYGWNGFFPPVDNIPVLNRVKAGSAIPVKFSLGCNQGLNIFFPGYPISGTMQCDNQDPIDDIEQTVNAGGSSLNYDPVANQYIYVWKTDKSWAGSCRQLTLKLADGTTHFAFFNFTR